jgi:hypothetical protein
MRIGDRLVARILLNHFGKKIGNLDPVRFLPDNDVDAE